MAQTNANPNLITRLADRGEQVVGRITDLPGAKTLIDKTAALAKNVDSMQKQLRSLDPLQKKVAALERRVEKLEGKGTTRKRTTTRKATAAKTAAAKPKGTTTRRRSTGA